MNAQAKEEDLLTLPFFRIDGEGNWYHDGAPIARQALVKLFADKGLKVDEEGKYWLQSPFEKYPVAVADVPFIITDYEEKRGEIDLFTNMGERIPLGEDRVLELRLSERHKMELPYIHVRDGLYARLGRNVYHALAQEYGASFESRGVRQVLGNI